MGSGKTSTNCTGRGQEGVRRVGDGLRVVDNSMPIKLSQASCSLKSFVLHENESCRCVAPSRPAPPWSYARIELSDIFHLVFMVVIYLILHTWFAFVSYAATLTIKVTHIQKSPLQRNDNVSGILTSCCLFWLHPKRGRHCRRQWGERGVGDGSTGLSRYRAQLFRFEGH